MRLWRADTLLTIVAWTGIVRPLSEGPQSMIAHRAIKKASTSLTWNPMGQVHRAVSADSMLGHRRYFAAKSLFDSDASVYLAGWASCYALHRGMKAASPMVDALDKILGNGTCGSARKVAASGFQSDAFFPSLVNKLPEGTALLGAKIGGGKKGRQGAEHGAYIGALIGCTIAWVLNQALALGNLYIKIQILVVAIVVGALLTAYDAPDLDSKRILDAAAYGVAISAAALGSWL